MQCNSSHQLLKGFSPTVSEVCLFTCGVALPTLWVFVLHRFLCTSTVRNIGVFGGYEVHVVRIRRASV